jgi:hypothetical protein
MRHLIPLAALAAAASACASGPAAQLSVYKPIGSRQCEGGGTTPESMARELATAGVKVIAATCGSDGRMHAAMCGAPDGRLAIFEIDAEHAAAAAKAGFQPLASMPSAQCQPCR